MLTILSDLSSVFLLVRLVISVTSIALAYCLTFIYFFTTFTWSKELHQVLKLL